MTGSAGTTAVALNGTFTAQELEEIIATLAQTRAGMQPAVPQEPPTGLETSVPEQESPRFRIRTRAGGGLRIWLRSGGYGWLAFSLTADQRRELVEFIGKQAGHTHTMQ
jgi:hypothetical protein